MPSYTELELAALRHFDADTQAAWAAGDWPRLTPLLIEHAVRSGEMRFVALLLEQESRNDETSLLLPHLRRLAELPSGPWREAALSIAAAHRDAPSRSLLRALDALVDAAPASAATIALAWAWRLADRALWHDAARFDAVLWRSVELLRRTEPDHPRIEELWLAAKSLRAVISWTTTRDAAPFEALRGLLAGPMARNRLQQQHALPLVAAGNLHASLGDWSTAVRALTYAVRLTPAGATASMASARAMLALAKYRRGDWSGSSVDASAVQAMLASTTSPTMLSLRAAVAALRAALAGDIARHTSHVQQAQHALHTRRSVIAEMVLLHGRVVSALAAQDWQRLRTIIELEDEPGYRKLYSEHEWTAMHALTLRNSGDTACYRALVRRWAEAAGATRSPYYWAHRGLLHRADGDHEGSREAVERMTELLRPDEDPLGQAWVHTVIGAIEADIGERRAAAAAYAVARAKFVQLGATHFSAYFEQIAARASQDRGAAEIALLSALTEQQRRVALLVADGYTSTEIATRLYLSKRTVDFHVSNVLTRLGLRTRREIKRLLDGPTDGR